MEGSLHIVAITRSSSGEPLHSLVSDACGRGGAMKAHDCYSPGELASYLASRGVNTGAVNDALQSVKVAGRSSIPNMRFFELVTGSPA